ncbi:hypothetical protein ABE29_18945 [Cytobacillus firmus]|uniref:hypothetical protein n=1 Tax=Cytobacillus firmus TaxID=1399 RepID=UPI00077C5842|nr:hypothetical protein [Cytobacillus firmus]MBG9544768.1 hypothetical protein [Cytobacillus firmus]MBG9551871.1 hypothetical protein [Cytobacillus firmus]MBG9559156.1 hypothetical protein [Cytobacillus firmus]MBG9577371.1 hypothetical protein [Cytobacillus firmus]MBG9653828.1 hypothetical protein [Cytobacillus firmus]
MADKNIQNGKMDNPEQYKTEKESLFDKYESEKNVDPIPMEDLKQEKEEEKNGSKIKSCSSTEEKYKADFETIKKKKLFGDKYDDGTRT